MRALTYDRYTDQAGLELLDVEVPELPADHVRVRVAAAGLNPLDWRSYRGEPWLMRMQSGLTVRERRIVGADLAGVVEAVGSEVRGLAPGDRVLGEPGGGAVAEFAVAPEASFAKLPDSVPFDVAAAAPMAGQTALQALRDVGGLQQGERVLVWGASGGVGHVAVQLARVLGAGRVDAICSGRNVEMVQGLGADTVFDRTTQERPTGPYDLIIDTVATASIAEIKPLLAPGGRVVTVGSVSGGRMLGPATATMRRLVSGTFQRADARMLMFKTVNADLELIAGLLGDGSLRIVLEHSYPLEEAKLAFERLEAGQVSGKLVVHIADL